MNTDDDLGPEVDSNKVHLLEYCTYVHILSIYTLLEYYFFWKLATSSSLHLKYNIVLFTPLHLYQGTQVESCCKSAHFQIH